MYCQSVKLSSGLRSRCVGELKAALIRSLGLIGFRIGICKIIVMAPNAANRLKSAGKSLICGVKMLSVRTISCETNRLMYKTSRDFGVVAGRQMAIIRHAAAHDAEGYAISIRSSGWKMERVCSANPMIDMMSSESDERVSHCLGFEENSSRSSAGSSTKVFHHLGGNVLRGKSFSTRLRRIHAATTAGIAEIYFKAQESN